MLERPQGGSCCTPEEARNQWIKFFADMEGGSRQTQDQLRDEWIAALAKEEQPGFELTADSLPTLVDLELAFRKVACGKAIGPDDVPGEVCHYAPAACARTTFSALWKLELFGHEALCYKGGLLVQAYKGKGATTQCSSYRSLLISSHIGKSIHRAMRSTQASIFESFMQAQQLGGRRAMPVTYGVHLVRAFQRQAKHSGNSCALIMLDLKEAFYRIFRPLCMDGQVTDSSIATLMHRLRMPQDALEALRRIMQEPCALQQAGMDWRQQRSVRAVHSQTHFWMQQQHDVVQTSHGSRPGDPFADIIFSYVWAIVLHKLQLFMQQQEILSEFPHRPSLPLFAVDEPANGHFDQFVGPTWMDDLCVCVEGTSPEILLRNAGLAAGKLLELCTEHCMTPNLQHNKTEVLFSFRGAQSRHFKKALFGPEATGQLPVINEYGTFQVPVTHRYCHLGGLLHHAADQKAEIRRRIAIAHSTVSQHRKLIFRNWQLPLQKRTQLFESLVMSKLLYGAETWVAMDDKTEKTFNAAILRLYRRLLPIPADQHLSDESILSQVLLPSPMELLRRARLRYVATLLHCGERNEWGLIEKDRPWILLVEDDMRWVWHQLRHCSHLQDPQNHWQQWVDIIVHHRSYWRRLVRRAIEHAIGQRRNAWHIQEFHYAVLQELRVFFDYMPHQQHDEAESVGFFGCLYCRKTCKSGAGEAAHMFKVHGHVATRRTLVDDTCCPACLREYHTMEKVVAHLYYSSRCRQILQSRNYANVPTPGAGSSVDRARVLQHDRLLPPLQMAGPHQQLPRLRQDPGIDTDLHLACVEALLDADDLQKAISCIKQLGDERPFSWTIWSKTMDFFVDALAEMDVVKFDVTLAEAQTMLREMRDAQTWDFEHCRRDCPLTLPHLEQECKDIAVTEWPQDQHIPRQFGKHRVLLHLFAGRRRRGDIQFFLDAMPAPTNFVLHVVSIDIVIDATWGNAMDQQTRRYWLNLAHQKFIIGFVAGPPCETWSKARGRTVDPMKLQGRPPPRVVRTAAHLWGLPSLSLKELSQVFTGNCLLTFTLHMACIMIIIGGLGIVEHPAEPDEEDAASIWRLPVVQALLAAPGVQKRRLSQGLFGAMSPKPTDLLVINLPDLPRDLRQWMTRSELPRSRAIGLDSKGCWKTGYLKEYPPAMCGALANALRKGMDGLCVDPSAEPHQADVQRWCDLTATDYGTHLGTDFAK